MESGLNLRKFKKLTDPKPAPIKSPEVLGSAIEKKIEELLAAGKVTLELDDGVLPLAYGIDWRSNTIGEVIRGTRLLVQDILTEYPELLQIDDLVQFQLTQKQPEQGGMSLTFLLEEKNGTDQIIVAAGDEEDGVATEIIEPQMVLQWHWVSDQEPETRTQVIRAIAALDALDTLRSIQAVDFSGIAEFGWLEAIIVITTRAESICLGKIMDNALLSERQTELQGINVSPNNMYIIMRAAAAWLGTLQTMKERGVTHRDIKPEHCFVNLDKPDNSELIDWGLAKLNNSKQAQTDPGIIYGTPHYLSKDAARGIPDSNRDMYALGIALSETLQIVELALVLPTVSEATQAAAQGTIFSRLELTGSNYDAVLRRYFRYPTERDFAFFVHRLASHNNDPLSYKGNYEKALADLRSIIADQRVWVEAMEMNNPAISAAMATATTAELRQLLANKRGR